MTRMSSRFPRWNDYPEPFNRRFGNTAGRRRLDDSRRRQQEIEDDGDIRSTRPLLYNLRRVPRPRRGRQQHVHVKLTITGADNGEPVITILEPDEE